MVNEFAFNWQEAMIPLLPQSQHGQVDIVKYLRKAQILQGPHGNPCAPARALPRPWTSRQRHRPWRSSAAKPRLNKWRHRVILAFCGTDLHADCGVWRQLLAGKQESKSPFPMAPISRRACPHAEQLGIKGLTTIVKWQQLYKASTNLQNMNAQESKQN